MRGTICVLGQNIHLKNHKPMLVAPFIGGTNLCQEIVLTKPRPVTLTELSINFHDFWDEPKTVNKYKFSRSKWYEATLYKNLDDARDWCEQQFGKEPVHPDAWSRWYFNVERTFRFRDEQDYMWFVLRWGK